MREVRVNSFIHAIIAARHERRVLPGFFSPTATASSAKAGVCAWRAATLIPHRDLPLKRDA